MEDFRPFIEFDTILNNKNVLFDDRVETLIKVWKNIARMNLAKCVLENVVHVVDWAILHSLNSILIAEWNCYKEHGKNVQDAIKAAQKKLVKLNPNFHGRCERLMYVVKVPWTHSILMNLMKTKNARISSEEIEFFHYEQTYLISMRVKILCESRCQDLALNLVSAFMTCYKALENASSYLNASEDQFWYMFDIHIALLYHFRYRKGIKKMIDQVSLDEGLLLVKRFFNKQVQLLKLWKNCRKIALQATQLLLTRAVNENDKTLTKYLETYIGMCSTDNIFRDLCANIGYICSIVNSSVIYACCNVIQMRLDPKLKAFLVEMFVKGLTADMNELEHQKLLGDNGMVAVITSRLAGALVQLGQLFEDNLEVVKECVLTAFSLEPTEERLLLIESLAQRSGFEISHAEQDWKCLFHPPVLPSDELTWKCPECDDWMCKPQVEVPLRMNLTLNEAIHNSILGLPGPLCDDLIVCISNPRYQILKWHLPWNVLHRLCIMYLKDPQATKNLVTELKFVDIDYSIFEGIKKEPMEEITGIEKGYEKFLDKNYVPEEKVETQKISEEQSYENYVVEEEYDPNSLESLQKYLKLQRTPSIKIRPNKMLPNRSVPIKHGSRTTPKKNHHPLVDLRNITDGKIQKKQNHFGSIVSLRHLRA
ncbi:hypothetical protein JTB14_034915 [Gonioctena quinquepunctata]|nr:hypothetical protein JTB14_034915 [Gonioctena quinquepunctata]